MGNKACVCARCGEIWSNRENGPKRCITCKSEDIIVTKEEIGDFTKEFINTNVPTSEVIRKRYYYDNPLRDPEAEQIRIEYPEKRMAQEAKRKAREDVAKIMANAPGAKPSVKCPACGSSSVSKISSAGKVAKVGFFGLFGAGDLGKTYRCGSCGCKF